ncbi:MAG: Holliday junction branch migration protein RuvA [Verrucomicrobiae bacterium]|nr:Holliday junction branch migration protein RuvA [Verrucomicrobiae bacterium]
MIAFLQGRLAEATPTTVVIDCHGVGYLVTIPVSSYEKLPPVGGEVKLLTYHHVNAQDGTQQLFGFATAGERDMFLLLIEVSGIGPKLACNILSGASVQSLRAAIAAGDTRALASLRGIGKKTAERLVVELRDKLGAETAAVSRVVVDPKSADAVLALVSLGFKQSDAQKAVSAAVQRLGATATVEELVRAALRSG